MKSRGVKNQYGNLRIERIRAKSRQVLSPSPHSTSIKHPRLTSKTRCTVGCERKVLPTLLNVNLVFYFGVGLVLTLQHDVAAHMWGKVFECQKRKSGENFSCLLNATFNLIFDCENPIQKVEMKKVAKDVSKCLKVTREGRLEDYLNLLFDFCEKFKLNSIF